MRLFHNHNSIIEQIIAIEQVIEKPTEFNHSVYFNIYFTKALIPRK